MCIMAINMVASPCRPHPTLLTGEDYSVLKQRFLTPRTKSVLPFTCSPDLTEAVDK